MNTAFSLRDWRVCCLIFLSSLGLTAVVFLGCQTKRDAKAMAKMVNDIVNRNQPPELVGRPHRSWPIVVALYPESYDWKEEERVRQAIAKLYQDRTEELWEELVRREADPSYCVVVAIEKTEDAEIRTVGDICTELAGLRLWGVFVEHFPTNPEKDGRPIYVDFGIDGKLSDWRKERGKKSLYELQVELGEKALSELAKFKESSTNIPKEDVDLARRKIEAEIKELRRTKQPVFLKGQSFSEVTYRKEVAKDVRDAVRSGSTEAIGIGK